MGSRAILLSLAMTIASIAPFRASAMAPTCQGIEQAGKPVSQLLSAANSAFEEGDTAGAEAAWKKIRECAPATTSDWPKAVYNLGLLEYRRGNLRQAIIYFEEVLGSHPNDKEPGGNIMETNRNYSNRSAMAISQCYEGMGQFNAALRYAWLAKTKYRYYSWCGTCYNSANLAMNKRIACLAVRASRVHILAGMLVVAFVVVKFKKPMRAKQSDS